MHPEKFATKLLIRTIHEKPRLDECGRQMRVVVSSMCRHRRSYDYVQELLDHIEGPLQDTKHHLQFKYCYQRYRYRGEFQTLEINALPLLRSWSLQIKSR